MRGRGEEGIGSGRVRATTALGATLALGATALVAGCSEGGAADEWGGRVDTLPSGTVVVHNPLEGIWGEGEAWRVVEEIRIGHVAMEEPEIFGAVNGLLLDEAGRVYLLDRQSRRVQVFDRDGTFVRSIGREGQGPGELADPIGIAWAGPGRLLVTDPNNARYSVFDTSGTYIEGIPRALGGYSVPWRGRIDDRGRLSEIAFTGGATSLIVMDSSFVPADTVAAPPFEGESFVLTTESGQMSSSVPYTSTQMLALSPDGALWLGVTGEYRLARLAPGGDTARVIEKEAVRLPVTDAERERAIEGLEWFTRQGGRVDPSRIPAEKPYFSRFFLGDDGHTWVQRTSAPEDDSTRLDVFDPEGRYLGAVAMPFAPSAYSIFGPERILTATTDSLGVPYVIRLRIEKPEG